MTGVQGSIGLRFILRHGAFVDVMMPLASASAIMHNWETRYYHVKDIPVITGSCLSGTSWCVNRDDVQAIHTVRLDQQPPNVRKSLLSGNN